MSSLATEPALAPVSERVWLNHEERRLNTGADGSTKGEAAANARLLRPAGEADAQTALAAGRQVAETRARCLQRDARA